MSAEGFRILVEGPRADFLSKEVYDTKEKARTEIDRQRRAGGWDRCRFTVVPADRYAIEKTGV